MYRTCTVFTKLEIVLLWQTCGIMDSFRCAGKLTVHVSVFVFVSLFVSVFGLTRVDTYTYTEIICADWT